MEWMKFPEVIFEPNIKDEKKLAEQIQVGTLFQEWDCWWKRIYFLKASMLGLAQP